MGTLIKNKILYGGSQQYYEMPDPSDKLLGTIVQFVGTTDTNYSNGYFYKCVEVVPATDPKTYIWERCDVQPNGSIDAYTKQETDELLAEKAALKVSTISTAGGGDEIHATISQGDDAVNLNYYKDGSTLPDYVNLSVDGDEFSFPTSGHVDDRIADVVNAAPFVATYEQTTYADVTAAIDADRAIVVNFSNNKNLICVTYATYVVGQNVTMSGIYKYGSGVSLAEITLTPENAWSIAHTWMQERLESGANIKTVNNQSLLGSGNIDVGGGDGNVFIARYQSTSFTDLISACESGKVICVQYTTNAEANPCDVLVRTETLIKLVYYRSITNSGNENPGNHVSAVQYSVSSDNTWTLNNYALPNATLGTSKTPSGDNLRISDASTLLGGEVRRFLNFNKKSGDDYVKVTAQDTATYEQIISWEALLAQTSYVDGVTGDLSTLTTDNKTNLVSAINEVYEKSGEPFRVKQWATNALNVTIVPCTSDAGNTSLDKMVFTIDDVEGASYQVIGMLAYEVFDAASGGNRINCWPVCQFTGNGQKELHVRWMCGGTTNKVAKRINAWVLLKHR